MSVLLRCPTCGTTQGHPGECEACSEGEVQYFCTNHDEGVWLESAVCDRCGARFGDAPRTPSARPASRVPAPPAGPPDFRAPSRRRRPEPLSEPDFGSPPSSSRAREEPVEPEVLPPSTVFDMLEELAAERARGRERYEAEVPWAEPRSRRPGVPLVGCLFRAVGLVFLLIVAAIILLFLVFSGFIMQ